MHTKANIPFPISVITDQASPDQSWNELAF
jgi:hypothetical protein